MLPRWRFPPGLFSIVSLLLCLASIALWIFSHQDNTTIPSNQHVEVSLFQQVPAFIFKKAPPLNFGTSTFGGAVQQISDHALTEFEIDWPALASLNIDRHTPVEVYLKKSSLGVSLATFLRSIDSRLEFSANGPSETIRISVRGARASPDGIECITPQLYGPTWGGIKLEEPWPLLPARRKKVPPGEFALGNTLITPDPFLGSLQIWLSPRDPAAIYQHSQANLSADPRFQAFFARAGFSLAHNGAPFDTWIMAIPFWFLVTATAIAPAITGFKIVRRLRRSRSHRCPHCNYDLRATPHLCPECGRIPSPKHAPVPAT